MSPRTCDTVHVFYVKAGQTQAQDIVQNVHNETTISPHFIEFLHTLGWPVDVHHHPGKTAQKKHNAPFYKKSI